MILVRSGGNLGDIVSLVQHEVRRLDASLPVGESFWVRDAFQRTVARQRFQTLLLSSFGIIGLLLAVLGVYGVLSLSVTRRSREIGVRLALGATPRDVVRSVVLQGLTAVGLGIAVGLALSYFTDHLLTDLLWGIGATDVPTYLASAGTIVLAGLGATWISARRALGIDPVDALKRE
jgi:putative ABC transport system permease protein